MLRQLLVRSLLLLQFPLVSHASNELHVSLLLINATQRNAYHDAIDDFSRKNPDIEVFVKDFESEYYKANVKSWLVSERHSDVMYWFSGQRLKEFISKGWVKELDSLWEGSGWSNQFTLGAESSVTFAGRKYALPVHYYPWAIYYKKSLFQRLSIDPPTSWKTFLEACEKLQQNNITPLILGSKYKWTLSIWFEYLNLRLNGLKFHQELLSGTASYKDPRVINVFEHWRILVDKGYFLDGHEHLTWRDVVPYLYRDKGGMTLLGSFWTSDIPSSFYDDIGMVSFPVIDSQIPVYEQAPTDVFMIPSNVRNESGAQRFLQYLALPEVQTKLSNAFGMLAPNPINVDSDDHLLNKSYQILDEAAGLSQFYDRDNPEPISTEGMNEFARFVDDPNQLSEVLDELERLRAISFK
ncbi:ABC transporter substrate-binding protein [Vibrio hannami]|uniref:ABC transporter substrate-binding protein n=1 Tax=Vibrio hannami TaxID=2717094 RepID=UPI003EBFF508